MDALTRAVYERDKARSDSAEGYIGPLIGELDWEAEIYFIKAEMESQA